MSYDKKFEKYLDIKDGTYTGKSNKQKIIDFVENNHKKYIEKYNEWVKTEGIT
jgi:hypothetical protein